MLRCSADAFASMLFFALRDSVATANLVVLGISESLHCHAAAVHTFHEVSSAARTAKLSKGMPTLTH